jgi:4-hydroxybenzoate polyprenyltransferase
MYCIPYSLAFGGVYLFTTIPDVETDAKHGKRTVAVSYSPKKAALLGFTLVVLSVVSGYFLNQMALFLGGIIAILLYVFAIIKNRHYNLANRLTVFVLALCTSFYYPDFIFVLVFLVVFMWFYIKLRFDVYYP